MKHTLSIQSILDAYSKVFLDKQKGLLRTDRQTYILTWSLLELLSQLKIIEPAASPFNDPQIMYFGDACYPELDNPLILIQSLIMEQGFCSVWPTILINWFF
jgi:hypothetical protein